MEVSLIGYITLKSIICSDCILEYGEGAELDMDAIAIWSDDVYDDYITCDFCGLVMDVIIEA
jgi:hypothetical protein